MDIQNQVPSVVDYIVVFLLGLIPLIGFIIMIVWAVGGVNTPKWKTNYARAYFVLFAILIIAGIALGGAILSLIGSALGGFY